MTAKVSSPVEPGQIWRHFKGGLYEVQAIALHCDTEEPQVIYKALYHTPKKVWVRSLEQWLEVLGNPPTFFSRFERLHIAENTQFAQYKQLGGILDYPIWKEKRYMLAKLVISLDWSEFQEVKQELTGQIQALESLLLVKLPTDMNAALETLRHQ